MSAAIIFGGYGVFGAHVARALAAAGVGVTVVGRNEGQAKALALTLGPLGRGLAVDVTDARGCRAALAGHAVAVNCAGSLAELGPALLEACLDMRCHYVDIAVERASAAVVRSMAADFYRRRLAAVFGCSSLPALSGALAVAACAGQKDRPERARVTLFIGNDNPKGRGAVTAFLEILGQPISAPQGTLFGFRDREVVSLPPPFGKRGVFNFDSPEYELFPPLLGVKAVTVKVGFELRLANYGLAFLAMTGLRIGARTAGLLAGAGDALRGLGCSGGVVLTELFFADGSCHRASLTARRDGQIMAALPCALAAKELCGAMPHAVGCLTAYELLGADRLLREVERAGFELSHDG